MNEDNILFLEKFIGSEWLDEEFRRINTRSPLKGVGARFASYHPWVHFKYELEYLLRRANIENREKIVMGRYHYILDNAGMLVRSNYDLIVDKKDAQKRLRNPEQFYDFIWELETITMLLKSGAKAFFNDPKSGYTCDGNLVIDNKAISFECKNKIVDNDCYNTNLVFSQLLVNRLGDIKSIQNKILQIEFEEGRLEDVRTIVAIIRDKFDIYDYQCILGRYKVRTIRKLPFDTPPQYLMNLEGVNSLYEINEVRKNEIYLDNPPSKVVKAKILFKIPEPVKELRNLNGVLKKANSQLAFGGIVFLHVPYTTLESAKKSIEKELGLSCSNIFAVKIISLDIKFSENKGVIINRLEDLILPIRGKEVLTEREIDFLNQPMIFNKYSNM